MDSRSCNEVSVYGVNFTRDKLNDTAKALLDGEYLVAMYVGPDVPVETVYFDKLTGTTTQARIKQNSCVKVKLAKGLKLQSFTGNSIYKFVVKMRTFWNREFRLTSSPASYNVSVITSCEKSYHRVLSLWINGEKFYATDRFHRNDVEYLFKFLQTVINEMLYLDGYEFEGKETVLKNAQEYYHCEFRKNELLFWVSHFDELFNEVMDAKSQPKTTSEVTRHRSDTPKEKKDPTHDRTTMGVPGIPESQIRLKSTKELADAVVTSKGYVVVNVPKTHGRAFWVVRTQDYEHFIVLSPKGKREFDRYRADEDHPLWRFYHHPTSYARLQEFAF